MNKQAFPVVPNSKFCEAPSHELAILVSNERIWNDAQPILDQDSIRRFCQVWGEVGRTIIGRRNIITA
jgi:hypothetical protein